MSAAMMCDGCGSVLAVDSRGDDEAGESSGWLKLVTSFGSFDLCTRACLAEFIAAGDFVEAHDERLAAVADIARIIREARSPGAEEAHPND